MNIFVTDPDPVASAVALDDIRLNKMIVESVQLLSTALWAHGVEDDGIYRPISNSRHPCSLWVRASRTNYLWLAEHVQAMVVERRYRGFWRPHACVPVINRCLDEALIKQIPDRGPTPFQNSSLFKGVADTCRAYRIGMRHKWANDIVAVTWQRRGPPAWKDVDEDADS